MATTTESLTIELPVRVAAALRAEAEAQGRFAAVIAAERLANLYAVAANEPPPALPLGDEAAIHAALYGPAHRFDPTALQKKYQKKYGIPDLSHLSREDIATEAEEIVANMAPEKRAEMERRGLL